MAAIKARRRARREAAAHMRTLGYSLAEIATDLGCSAATVAELLAEATAKLGDDERDDATEIWRRRYGVAEAQVRRRGRGNMTTPNDPKLLAELEQIIKTYSSDRLKPITDFVVRHPEYRRHVACALLGDAIAWADSFGVDAQKFLDGLRENCGKAGELLPPQRKLQ